ncbi:aspartate/glutamate racemase family protein [Ensifer soli]|uniref:aspartate/glutamate racemase family protein n=1 Tax=Ciceribacter sp. sgz301302 TaxID=3342379 RepID=UPI0035B8C315
MKRIGLIGGMSFESSAVYYKLINERVRAVNGGLHSADLLLHSLNFQVIVDCQKAGRWDEAARHLIDAARGLERAGADCVLICTNTMHLVADEVKGAIGIPLIHIIDETAARLKQQAVRRPLLLATRYTMEHGFYAGAMARHGIDLRIPDAAGRTLVHDVIFEELCAGVVRPESRDRVEALVTAAKDDGADGVILGCTEICLLLDPDRLPLPGFDSTRIHAEAAVAFALESDERGRDAA